MQNKNQVLIYGKHAVSAALNNPRRKIGKLYCLKENLDEWQEKIADNKIAVVDKKELEKMLPREAVHQGVVAVAEMLPNISLEDLCDKAREQNSCHILMLDQVTDPQTIGAIIRSCAAFNISALIMQDKNSPQESGAMVKASAGTIEFLPVCRVTNLSRALETLKQNGFWCIGMDGYAKHSIDKINKNAKIAVVMGSEGKGLRRLVQDNCDDTVKLLINPNVESLNVSVAAAIALYELSKF